MFIFPLPIHSLYLKPLVEQVTESLANYAMLVAYGIVPLCSEYIHLCFLVPSTLLPVGSHSESRNCSWKWVFCQLETKTRMARIYLGTCYWIFSCLLRWVISSKSLDLLVSLLMSSHILSHFHVSFLMKSYQIFWEKDPRVCVYVCVYMNLLVIHSGTKVWYLRFRAQVPGSASWLFHVIDWHWGSSSLHLRFAPPWTTISTCWWFCEE